MEYFFKLKRHFRKAWQGGGGYSHNGVAQKAKWCWGSCLDGGWVLEASCEKLPGLHAHRQEQRARAVPSSCSECGPPPE